MMKFVIFTKRRDLFSREIAQIQSLLAFHRTHLVIITDTIDLVAVIPTLCRERTAVILFASSDEELEDLVCLRKQFGAIPTVLVLPDDRPETCQKGMLLNPYYFMTQQDNFRYVSSAINQLCNIYEEHSNRRASGFFSRKPRELTA